MIQITETANGKKANKRASDVQQTISKTTPISTSAKPSPSTSTAAIMAEQRNQMITEAAYVIAEQRGFTEDSALDDWLQAEAEVDSRIAKDNV